VKLSPVSSGTEKPKKKMKTQSAPENEHVGVANPASKVGYTGSVCDHEPPALTPVPPAGEKPDNAYPDALRVRVVTYRPSLNVAVLDTVDTNELEAEVFASDIVGAGRQEPYLMEMPTKRAKACSFPPASFRTLQFLKDRRKSACLRSEAMSSSP